MALGELAKSKINFLAHLPKAGKLELDTPRILAKKILC